MNVDESIDGSAVVAGTADADENIHENESENEKRYEYAVAADADAEAYPSSDFQNHRLPDLVQTHSRTKRMGY